MLVASFALVALAAVLVASSVQRYLVGQPLGEVEDIAGLLFVAIAFLPMAEGYLAERQLRVQFLWRLMPSRSQTLLRSLGDVLTLVAAGILAVETFHFAETSRIFGSRIVGSGHLLWPWMMMVPLGFTVLAFAVAIRLLVDVGTRHEGARED